MGERTDHPASRLAPEDGVAILLAACGLDRMGLAPRITERISTETLLPAACQGIIAIQSRDGDESSNTLAESVGSKGSMLLGRLEREFMAAVKGGCNAPVGCLSWYEGTDIVCDAMCATPDGTKTVWKRTSGKRSEAIGLVHALAEDFLLSGGRSILESVRASAS